MSVDELASERAWVLELLGAYVDRLPRALRTGVAQPSSKRNNFFPMALPRDMWDGQPDAQGLVVYVGVADRPVEEFENLADVAFGLTHLSAPRPASA